MYLLKMLLHILFTEKITLCISTDLWTFWKGVSHICHPERDSQLVIERSSDFQTIFCIEIVDKIPNIADLEKGLSIGTLHPTKILKHERKGTIIKWLIEQLDAGDERVISYKIKSHLSILGEFRLKSRSLTAAGRISCVSRLPQARGISRLDSFLSQYLSSFCHFLFVSYPVPFPGNFQILDSEGKGHI